MAGDFTLCDRFDLWAPSDRATIALAHDLADGLRRQIQGLRHLGKIVVETGFDQILEGCETTGNLGLKIGVHTRLIQASLHFVNKQSCGFL